MTVQTLETVCWAIGGSLVASLIPNRVEFLPSVTVVYEESVQRAPVEPSMIWGMAADLGPEFIEEVVENMNNTFLGANCLIGLP